MAGGTAIISAVAAALGMTIVGGILTCSYLNRAKLLEIIKNLKKKLGMKALGAKVKRKLKSGDYNKLDLGLTTGKDLELQAKKIDSDVYEGLELSA